MKKKIFIAAAVIFSSTVQGQDSARNLNEVIISANKYPGKASLTGKVVSVISRADLERAGGKDLAQVLTEQVGMYINGAGSNPGKDKSVYLRGAKPEHTLISIDGVPVYDASGIGSNFDIRLIPISQIERIEILKGSQSTLYGSDAIAGVINIITRKGLNNRAILSGLVSLGSYHTGRAEAALQGHQGKWDYQISYTGYRTRGINEVTDTAKGTHPTDKDGYRQQSVYASLGFQANVHLLIRPYLRYSKIRGDIDQGAFTDELDYTYTARNIQAGARMEWSLGRTKINLLYNYNNNHRKYIDDSTLSRNGFAIYSKGTYQGTEQFIDGFAVIPLTQKIKLTAGMDYRKSESDQSYYSLSSYGPYASTLGADSLHHHQLSLYATAVFHAASGFNLEAGSRMNHHSTYGNNWVWNLNPSWLFGKKWKTYINLSSAYRTPSLYQLFSEYGNKYLQPETAINVEAGLQWYSAGNKGNGRVTYFNRAIKNVIAFVTDPNSYRSFYVNQDRQNDQGVELEYNYMLNKKITLKLQYSFITGQLSTTNGKADTSFFNLYRRPKSSLGIQVEDQINKHVYFSTGMQLTGKRTDIIYDASFEPVPVQLKAYVLWNMYGEYKITKGRLKIFADLHNISNTQYTEVMGFNAMGFNGTAGLRFSL